MALDPSIILQGRGVQLDNPLDNYAKVNQLKAMQQQGQMQEFQMQNALRQQRTDDATRSAYALDDPEQRMNALRRADPQAYRQEAGFQVSQQKAQREAEKAKLEDGLKRFEVIAQIMSGVKDQPSYEAAIGQLVQQFGFPMSQFSPKYDPATIEANRVKAMPIKEQMEQKWKEMNFGLEKEKFSETKRHNTTAEGLTARGQNMSNATSIRGQDMANARAIDKNSIEAGKYTAEGVRDLRKEFNALPEVKSYKQVLPIIESIRRAPNTTAGDLDLIYGVGKIMDPESVVREGEMNLVIKSGSPAQRMQSYWSYVTGGARLTQAMRKDLMNVLNSRTKGLEDSYSRSKKTFEATADKQGLPKDQIFVEAPSEAVSSNQSSNQSPTQNKPANRPSLDDIFK